MSTSRPRAIDLVPGPEPSKSHQLQVLVVGAPRSGTTSLGTALQILGYETCVGVAHSYFVENHFPYWTEAIAAKYHGQGRAYAGEDFDKFLGKYEAVTGWGAALLAEELMEALPEAKVICTDRDAGKWVESYNKTIVHTYLWWRKWVWMLPLCGGREREFVRFKKTALHAWSYGNPLDKEEQKRYYVNHNERMKRIIPEDRLLIFNAEDGWEALCKFLGKDVPTTPYPHAAVRTGFHQAMTLIWRRALLKTARNVSVAAVVTGLLVMAVRKQWQGERLPLLPYSLLGRR